MMMRTGEKIYAGNTKPATSAASAMSACAFAAAFSILIIRTLSLSLSVFLLSALVLGGILRNLVLLCRRPRTEQS